MTQLTSRVSTADAEFRLRLRCALESMKMELHADAPFAATVQSVRCARGDMVERGAVLADPSPGPAGRKE